MIVIVTMIVIVIPQLTQFIVLLFLEPDEYSYHTRMILVGGTVASVVFKFGFCDVDDVLFSCCSSLFLFIRVLLPLICAQQCAHAR